MCYIALCVLCMVVIRRLHCMNIEQQSCDNFDNFDFIVIFYMIKCFSEFTPVYQ
jgi:predicted membrane channel-forming protein YqfA (hemolysin III family)